MLHLTHLLHLSFAAESPQTKKMCNFGFQLFGKPGIYVKIFVFRRVEGRFSWPNAATG